MSQTQQSIEQIITAAISQEGSKAAPERHSVPWDNGEERLLVVNLPLSQLKLNPNSHRIKAQLLAHPKRDDLLTDPFSEETQGTIADLLRQTEEFDRLKEDLRERGQKDPGVVTRGGVLVNANTRAVALRDLDKTHLKALVLPENATNEQIAELELRLQVSKDYRQEYTFTNRLLFIKDCQTAGWTEERIAREVYGTDGSEGRRVAKVKRDLRVLTMIDEIIAMAKGNLRYPDFDERRTALEELDKEYQQLKTKDATAAARLRSARLVAILTGVQYRDIRKIDSDFASRYLVTELTDDTDLQFLLDSEEGDGSAPNDEEPAGLDLLDASGSEATEDVTSSEDTAAKVLGWFTRTAGDSEVSVTIDGATTDRARADIVDQLQTAVENATEQARLANRRVDLLKQPLADVKNAATSLASAEDAYEKARTDPKYSASHRQKLLDKVDAVSRQIDSLRRRVDADSAADGEAS